MTKQEGPPPPILYNASPLVRKVVAFPPKGPTGRLITLLSYLYQEYSDDEDLQAFVDAQNQWQQDFTDTFNGLNLPYYVSARISGELLDWVGEGLYGYPRPYTSVGFFHRIGPYNTFAFETLEYNRLKKISSSNNVIGDDDTYKRCLTWHFYKGDGKYFNVRWLKRRVWRWIIGVNGAAPPIQDTYRVSITFGTKNEVTIRIVMGQRRVTGGAVFNKMAFNSRNPFNSIKSAYVAFPEIPRAADLVQAIQSGVLELPFQYKFNVIIN
jgi:hypothetical protein